MHGRVSLHRPPRWTSRPRLLFSAGSVDSCSRPMPPQAALAQRSHGLRQRRGRRSGQTLSGARPSSSSTGPEPRQLAHGGSRLGAQPAGPSRLLDRALRPSAALTPTLPQTALPAASCQRALPRRSSFPAPGRQPAPRGEQFSKPVVIGAGNGPHPSARTRGPAGWSASGPSSAQPPASAAPEARSR